MGDGCDVNATLTHVGERLKGPASICCAACLNTTGCTGFTWCANHPTSVRCGCARSSALTIVGRAGTG